MRAADYMLIASKDLRRQFIRSTLTVIALVISTVILVTMAAISLGGQQAVTSQFGSDDSLKTVTVTPNQSSGGFGPFGGVQEVNEAATKLDDASVRQLEALPHVQQASPRAYLWEFDTFTVEGSDKQFVAQAQGIPANAWLPLEAGTPFATNDDANVAILGYSYAKELGVPAASLVGKTIRITTQEGYRGDGADIPGVAATKQENDAFNKTSTTLNARIVGVSAAGQNQNGVFIPLGWAHGVRTAQYAGPDGLKTSDQLAENGYASVQLKVDAKENVQSVAAAVEGLGFGQLSTLAQIQRIQQFSVVMWTILGAVAVIALVAAALGVVNTMLMAVSEQRYAIGVWRACGARRGFIVKLFLLEAALLGLMGGIVGVTLGVVASQLLNGHVNTLLETQRLTLTTVATTPAWLLVGAVALTTVFSLVAGFYPAMRAARADPSRALSSGQ